MKPEIEKSLKIMNKAAQELQGCEMKEGDALIFLSKKDENLSYCVRGPLDDVIAVLYISSVYSPVFLKAMKKTVSMLEKSKKDMENDEHQ